MKIDFTGLFFDAAGLGAALALASVAFVFTMFGIAVYKNPERMLAPRCGCVAPCQAPCACSGTPDRPKPAERP